MSTKASRTCLDTERAWLRQLDVAREHHSQASSALRSARESYMQAKTDIALAQGASIDMRYRRKPQRAKLPHERAQARRVYADGVRQVRVHHQRSGRRLTAAQEELRMARMRECQTRTLFDALYGAYIAWVCSAPTVTSPSNVVVSRSHERVDIYFGGVTRPDGEGHGHYIIDSDYRLSFTREPVAPVHPR